MRARRARVLLRILAPAALLLAAGPASGVEAPTLEQRVERFLRDRVPGRGVSIRVPRIPVTPHERAALAPSISVHPRQRLSGRVPVRVSLFEGERAIRSLVVPVEVDATREVLVALRDIRVGEPLGGAVVELRSVSSRGLPSDPVSDPAVLRGTRARRAVRSGSVLRASALETRTAIRRGQRVRLSFRSGGLRIESEARAREDGNVGDWIEAENLISRKRVLARVGEDGRLHVGP